MFIKETVFETKNTLLRPLKRKDFTGFYAIAGDKDTWKWYAEDLSLKENLQHWIAQACDEFRKEVRYPFTIIDKKTKELAGSTSFLNISFKDERIEIGHTWMGKKFHSTGLNREAKFLLFTYAFEALNMKRVELKTDVINLRSRRAIEKVGGVEEGILRSHMIMQNGRRRDSIYYSILSDEWPQVKKTVFGDLT